MHTWTHTHGHTHMHMDTHTCTHGHTHTWTYTHMHTWTYTHIHMDTHTHTWTRTHGHTHAYIHRLSKSHTNTSQLSVLPAHPQPHPLAHQAVDDKDVKVLVEVVGEPSLLPLYPQIERFVWVVCVHIRVRPINVGEDVVSYHVLQQTCHTATNVLRWLAKSLSHTDCLILEGSRHHCLTTPTPLWPRPPDESSRTWKHRGNTHEHSPATSKQPVCGSPQSDWQKGEAPGHVTVT